MSCIGLLFRILDYSLGFVVIDLIFRVDTYIIVILRDLIGDLRIDIGLIFEALFMGSFAFNINRKLCAILQTGIKDHRIVSACCYNLFYVSCIIYPYDSGLGLCFCV